MTHTHTYVVMEVSPTTFAEVKQKLLDAGYDHAVFDGDDGVVLDMHGLAFRVQEEGMALNEESS